MTNIRRGYADTRHGQIHYRRVDGAGPPIVLLHRTPVDSGCFEPMLERMAGHRAAIALDTPGFGASFRPDGEPTTIDYALWLLAALDALGIGAFHLFGHHTGSHLGAEIAARARGSVCSLMLSGVLYMDAAERSVATSQIRATRTAPAIDSDGRYLSQAWSIMRGLYKDFRPDLIHSEVIGALTSRAALHQSFRAVYSQDFPGMLAQAACPIAICQAVDDPLGRFLDRVRVDYPDIPIDLIGPASLATPELQTDDLTDIVLAFARSHDAPPPLVPKGKTMTDTRLQLVRSGGRFELKQVQAERPEPRAGEVLVRVRAAALNQRDVMIREGHYPVGPADGFTPLSDAAGDIVAVGPGVSEWAVGDRVASTFFQNWPQGRITGAARASALGSGGPGVLAEHVVLSAGGVTAIPDSWSYEEGATLPCAGVTAWSGLVTQGRMQAGDWVLIMGTGGVALFGLQVAAAFGARTVVISSSDEKLEKARALGATATVNYSAIPEWQTAVREATGGEGVQQVLELGGSGTLAKSLASMATGGHMAVIGALTGFGGDISAAGMIMGAQQVSAITVGSRADQLGLTKLLVDHGVRPVIDSVFDLGDVEQAYARMGAGPFGKVIIKL